MDAQKMTDTVARAANPVQPAGTTSFRETIVAFKKKKINNNLIGKQKNRKLASGALGLSGDS